MVKMSSPSNSYAQINTVIGHPHALHREGEGRGGMEGYEKVENSGALLRHTWEPQIEERSILSLSK